VLFGLVWNVHDHYVEVIPITSDVQMADDTTARLEAEQTGGLGSLAVWVGLEAPIELSVLDSYWGSIDIDEVGVVRRLVRLGKPIDALHVSTGSPISNAFDDRYEYRSIISDAVESLRSASWAPSSSSASLPDLISKAGTDMTAVTAAIGASPTERLRLLRGQRCLDSVEAKQLAPLLHVEPEDVLATNPAIPSELIAAINQPRWKRNLVAYAESAQLVEADARQNVAYAVLALAARQTHFDSQELMWHERLKQYFAT
jgi:hypothetical protein